MWRVEFDIRAEKKKKKLAPETRRQILRFFQERIATDLDPRRFGKGLTANLSGLWRYRIEDYRVICQIQDDTLVVLALKIGHRREIYRR